MNYDGQRICGVADTEGVGRALCRWPGKHVTWTLDGTLGGFSRSTLAKAYSDAWDLWAAACGITHAFVASSREAMVVIGFGHIDGPSGTLAWSGLPCGSVRQLQQKYDTSEAWVISSNPPNNRIDLVRVACHEIGHVIGIPHINTGNLMAPTYSSRIGMPQPGDIAEAVARYGLPSGGSGGGGTPSEIEELMLLGKRSGKLVMRVGGPKGQVFEF